MKKKTILLFVTTTLIVMVTHSGCRNKTRAWSQMDLAESILETYPDSALSLLKVIDKSRLGDKEEQARYSLLMSKALDKNYIDITTFSILQPAIDYYIIHGTTNEKLQTFYYQACIYRNRGDDGSAMASCIEALDLKGATDSLTIARLLVGQSVLYEKQYKLDEFTANNIMAAKLFHSKDQPLSEIRSSAKALNGAVCINNKHLADSLANICTMLVKEYPDGKKLISAPFLSYVIKYGTNTDIINYMMGIEETEAPNNVKIDLARGYLKIGDTVKSLSILNDYNYDGDLTDSLKYYAVLSDILEKANRPTDALNAYKQYLSLSERFHVNLFNNDLLFAEKKHQLELTNLMALQKRNIIIRHSMLIIIILLITTLIVLIRLYNVKAKRTKAEYEKHEAILQQENLRLEIIEIEHERDKLKELIKERCQSSDTIQSVIKNRLDILNSLLAKEITNDESHATPYRKWIENVHKNKEEFLESTKIALKVSYPSFYNYLIEHDLSDVELKYVSLFAIGLKGKEIGVYLQSKSHYNISSNIRKKLNINEHETNLNLYIRRKINELN